MCKQPKKGNTNTPVRNTTLIVGDAAELESNVCTLPRSSKSDDSYVTHRSKIVRSFPSNENYSPTSASKDCKRSLDTAIIDDLKSYIRDLFRSEMESIRGSIDSLTDAIKTQNYKIEQLEARVTTLEKKTEEPGPATAIESVVAQIQTDIAQRDQALLSNDVEIANCPETPNENCTNILLRVAKKLGVEISEKDVMSADRVGLARTSMQTSGPLRPRPVAVRLAHRGTRDALLQAARARRDLNSDGVILAESVRPLYVNERLTKFNRLLFQKARMRARDHGFKYVWIRDGKIFVRQGQEKPRHRLRNETDLISIFGTLNTG